MQEKLVIILPAQPLLAARSNLASANSHFEQVRMRVLFDGRLEQDVYCEIWVARLSYLRPTGQQGCTPLADQYLEAQLIRSPCLPQTDVACYEAWCKGKALIR